MILLASIALIVFESLPEGLALAGHKTLAGVIEGVYIAVVTILIMAWLTGNQFIVAQERDIIPVIGGYILLRFAIFDFIHNLAAGLPLMYIGKTKISDRLWQWFFKVTRFPVGLFFGMLKLICFLIGLTWLL